MLMRNMQLLEFATVTPCFIQPDHKIYKGSKLSRVYCLLDQESCVASIELKKIMSKLDFAVNSGTFGWVDEEGFTESGFSNVTKLGQVKIGGALMATLVERWRPESHTFHLPIECTGGSTLKLKWLKEHMLTLLAEPTPQKLAGHCKAYILGLIGGVLMPDKSGNKVHLIWRGRGLRFSGISRGDVIDYKSRFDNMHNEEEELTVVLDEQVEPQEHSRQFMTNVSSSLPIVAQDAKAPSYFIRNTANFSPSVWGDYFLYYVPNVFYKFKDQTRNFSEKAANDIQGMLSLYEAAELRMHGEDILEEAHNFALVQLTESLTTQLSPSMIAQVKHSLRRSLRKGLPRLEATYYMSFYEEDSSHDEKLLTFAKLDFNMLQELHQKEVNNVTRWWIKNLNVSTKLPFVRDRIAECYFWILGIYFEPQYSLARRITTKVIALCSVIDDMYDAYGTIDELELFTNAIERWDICCLDDLPEYMKVCYIEILNVYEEIEEEMRKQGKVYCIKYAKKEMKRLIKAHMAEARWLHCNHTPSIEEYMQVRNVSSGYSMVITICFVGMKDTTEEVLIWATSDPIIIGAASIICRLMDDIVGNEFEQERRHVASSIESYMKQHNTSRQDAINKLLEMVKSAWKDINEACLNPTEVPMNFLLRVVNLVRMIDVLYKDEDNYTNAGGLMKDYIKTLLVNKMSARINEALGLNLELALGLNPELSLDLKRAGYFILQN
ncbi:(-)-germacrene D synthase [Glycine soja]